MTDMITKPFKATLDLFLARCATYCEKARISEARLSTLLFNHGARISQIREKDNAGTAALDAACKRLTDLETQLTQRTAAE